MSALDGVLAIAHLTWLDTRRRRIVLAALICALGIVAVFALAMYASVSTGHPGARLSPVQKFIELQVLSLAGLYAGHFLVVAISVVLPVDTLSGDISSGVMQTIASKPIRRSEIVLGKWLVYWLMLVAYIVLVAGGIALAMWLVTGFVQRNLFPAMAFMSLESAILLTITIVGGTRLSTVTNGIAAFGFYALAFIGGWIEQVGVLTSNASARYVGTAISLISPSESIWRLAMQVLQPPVMSQAQISPFSPGSVPSTAMIWWAVGFVVVGIGLAIRAFRKRPL